MLVRTMMVSFSLNRILNHSSQINDKLKYKKHPTFDFLTSDGRSVLRPVQEILQLMKSTGSQLSLILVTVWFQTD